jgi:hypothetical protein
LNIGSTLEFLTQACEWLVKFAQIENPTMADPLSMAASLVAVTSLALTSTQILYNAIDSLVNAPQTIANVKNDLGAVQTVLQSLSKVLEDRQAPAVESVLNQMGLNFALKSCKTVCDDFAATIAKYTSHSTEARFAKRDRLTVSFRKSKIAAFTERLGLCKQTLSLVLNCATLYVARFQKI